ncbi:transcriptional regulator, TetR family [Paenibacillus sp. UNCCL117]|uniref:TetR/AcrR family transcriptional regulator n=1 Tax=unclassified Paenibacillus TaxID=185978 RepID=UPI00087EF493|nr:MULTISPECIES: TetR family transcriptional regulator [unclassified Paenibacillus]SDC13573.1 transcriptional regulator, TetR family [Paenibacillus sp. cl123]SFW17099.1 transcriptional regulator, TetR family [Paenibacillus sp. UNCCL117]
MPKLGAEPKRRAEVINATLTCISIHGIDGMTLDKVAEYADCSKGVVAYYFKNKENLTVEAFKSFMAYYGLKIQSELKATMTAAEMIDVTLKYILPPYRDDTGKRINVSQLDGIERMFIPFEAQGKLFLQFFSKAVLNSSLQEVVVKSYTTDLQGIAKIFEYGHKTGQMTVEDAQSAAYGLMAMVVGLSFFRVANIPPAHGEDNRYIGEEYVRKFCRTTLLGGEL